ncbi:mitogen-activated protein kinase kinase kinase 3-like isoform X2 [Dioscorea cayenensis subsp. rotundata]|uniref:mitogen-activated protein kinase kinase kinase n=1 Tax=Dioscorea cayennensis subsp. rotundata TaxID=55577 RepID=A0AB40BEU0_DIOCR|nr:mitogen-activated protein kinase kinase kinase 3-like isoform X2 [Dioscorea cayenensis subsp. rotundata]
MRAFSSLYAPTSKKLSLFTPSLCFHSPSPSPSPSLPSSPPLSLSIWIPKSRLEMPAWWPSKSKSKAKSKSTPRKSNPKEELKASSFDGVSVTRTPPRELSPAGGGAVAPLFSLGYRLPLPCELASASSLQTHDQAGVLVTGSISASSSTSYASSDENPELGFLRHPELAGAPKEKFVKPELQKLVHVPQESHTFLCNPSLEHAKCYETSVSQKKDFPLYCGDVPSSSGTAFTHGQTFGNIICNQRSANGGSGSRGHPFHTAPTSPIHQKVFSMCPESATVWQDDMRCVPHPLPLPPGSPTSSSSQCLRSHWKKGKLIGRGTFGHVYQGFNSGSGQMCAIKEVSIICDDSNSKECLRQLNQEITLLSQLSHPNIVRYYGSELVDGTLSVYLEYVSGGSIYKLLQEYGPFKEPVIQSYTRQILSGLAYLHGRNTIHRDIKGANILVDTNGEIKLADFGMAKHISAYTSIRSFKGSPNWMAPEVIMNNCGYTLSVDIWSLGCTILEMATSKPPWSQYEGAAAIFKIGNGKDIPEIPDHLSEDGKSFLKLCLQRDPSARPTAAKLLEHPFVQDQTPKTASNFMFMNTLPSRDRNHNQATSNLYSRRSISPLRDREYSIAQTNGFSLAFNARSNLSLPVSPCSSPLRQCKQSNRSYLLSPPHPAFSTGAINYSPANYSLYPTRPTSNFLDPWPEIHPLKLSSTPFDTPLKSTTPFDSPRMSTTPYGSPRRHL